MGPAEYQPMKTASLKKNNIPSDVVVENCGTRAKAPVPSIHSVNINC